MTSHYRPAIFAEIDAERAYQQTRWGNETDDTVNTPWMWVSYIAQYATKWMMGKFTLDRDDISLFRQCMIKTAATAVAAIESIDRQRAEKRRTFYEPHTSPFIDMEN